MVGTNQILFGSRHLPRHFQGWFVVRRLVLATINLPTNLEVSISTHYEDMKNDTKCRGGLGQLEVTQKGH